MPQYDPSAVITFPAGLPGFEGATRFVLAENPESSPVVSLLNAEQDSPCFLAVPLSIVDSEYRLDINEDDLGRLGFALDHQPVPGPDVLCLALICAPQNGPATANLLAPIVVNVQTRVAVQAVRADSRYSHQHPIGVGASCS